MTSIINNDGAAGGMSAKQKKQLLFNWYACSDDCSIETHFSGNNGSGISAADLSYFRAAIDVLDLAALRRLRNELDGAKVDALVRSKIKHYVAAYPLISSTFSDAELIRTLVIDWFVADDRPSIHNYLKMRGETKMAARVNQVVQKAGLQRLRNASQGADAEVIAVEKIDSVLPLVLSERARGKHAAAAVREKAKLQKKKKINRRRKKKEALPPKNENETQIVKNEGGDDDWMDISICSEEL